ncbi:MAG: hypothetical protein MUP17_09980 [candidate division Zixibacteria bacterium]|nr:hypothetical protein [candidate division Zixibacteria bacterium]
MSILTSSILNEADLEEIMGMPLSNLKTLARDDEEFVRIVRLAINKGIQLGRERAVLAYNRSLRERIN